MADVYIRWCEAPGVGCAISGPFKYDGRVSKKKEAREGLRVLQSCR